MATLQDHSASVTFWIRPNGSKYSNHDFLICSTHVIPPSSSGRLQEMNIKIGENSSKIYHFFEKIQDLPEMNQEFSYIFFTFFKNLPEMEEKSP